MFGPPDLEMRARILDFSGRGMRLLVDRSLPSGAAVKVETEDALLLGETCYSLPTSGGFEVGLELQHSLNGLRELARLNRQLVAGWQAPPPLQQELLKDEVTTRSR